MNQRDEKKPSRQKPYQPPAIEEDAVFETLALTCGKKPTDVDIGLCNPNHGGEPSAS